VVLRAVHGGELLTRQPEGRVLDGSLDVGFLTGAVAENVAGVRVREDRCVEGDRLLGLSADVAHEHECGGDALGHFTASSVRHLP
jgi:hypothetical protein